MAQIPCPACGPQKIHPLIDKLSRYRHLSEIAGEKQKGGFFSGLTSLLSEAHEALVMQVRQRIAVQQISRDKGHCVICKSRGSLEVPD